MRQGSGSRLFRAARGPRTQFLFLLPRSIVLTSAIFASLPHFLACRSGLIIGVANIGDGDVGRVTCRMEHLGIYYSSTGGRQGLGFLNCVWQISGCIRARTSEGQGQEKACALMNWLNVVEMVCTMYVVRAV